MIGGCGLLFLRAGGESLYDDKMAAGKKNLFLGIAILLATLAAAVVWYVRRAPEPLPDTTAEDKAGLGAQIFEGAQNPLKGDVPETNPFSADTNPFKTETNPYKDTYKNPFE